MDSDSYLWSVDDCHFWRWIVHGEGMATIQTRWPNDVSSMYLATDSSDVYLMPGGEDSMRGNTWSARFYPHEPRKLRIFYIELPSGVTDTVGTPVS